MKLLLLLLLQLLLVPSTSNLFADDVEGLLIKREIQAIRDSQIDELKGVNGDNENNKFKTINSLEPTDSMKSIEIIDEENSLYENQYYGYNYFSDFSSRLLLKNMPPLDDYKIGPGD